MDSRLRRHAETLADATDVDAGDHVVVSAPTAAEPLVVALYEVCGERNARPTWLARSPAANRARIRAADPDEFGVSEHALGLVENSDTVHLALGRAYEENVPDGMKRNESDLHLDMLVDMSTDARIEFDGEVVQRDGVFCFEDEFAEQRVSACRSGQL